MNKLKSIMKKSKFWKVYIISIASLVCIMIAFFVLLSFVLSDYEDSLGANEINKIAEYIKTEKYDYILENTDVIKGAIESKDNYVEALKNASKGKNITIGTAYSYDSENKPIYSIKADDEVLFKIVLKKSKEESTFGFTKYEFDYITDFSFGLIDVTFRIEDDVTAYIDGHQINEMFFAKDYFTSDASEGTKVKQYEIKGLMSYPELFKVESSQNGDFEISNISKTENGYTLTSQNDIEDNIKSFDIYYWEDKFNVEAKYENSKEATVEYDFENKKCSIKHKSFEVLIPSYYSVESINNVTDIKLSDFLIEKNIEVDELKNVPEKYYTKPTYNKYKFTVKSGDFNIKAVNLNGDEVQFSSDDMQYVGDFIVIDKDIDKYKNYYDIAENGAKKYAEFITNDISFGPLAKEMVSGTVMYETMNEYYKHSQYMYTDHDNTEFKNIEKYDLKIYDKNCFSCAVHFEQWIYGQRDNPEFEATIITDIRIWFVNDNGKWKMADYELFDRK